MPDATTTPEQDVEKILGRSPVQKKPVGPQQTPEDDIQKILGKKVAPVQKPEKKSIWLSKEERTGSRYTAVPGSDSEQAINDRLAPFGELVPQSAVPALVGAKKYAVDPLNKMAEKGAAAGADFAEGMAMAPMPERDYMTPPPKPQTREQFEKEHPTQAGIARGVGGVVGGTLADPRNWPFFAAGSARPILQRIISGGFGTQMAVGTIDSAKRLHDDWDKLTPAQRSELATSTGLSAIMTAAAAYHETFTEPPKAAKSAPGFKNGSTQADIPQHSEAHQALETARNAIADTDLAGKGKDIGGNHVTVRYGIKGDDVDGVRNFLRKQAPFEATLGKTEKFEPTEQSEGAAVVKAPIDSPELHRINRELEKHGDFIDPTFDYKPHATVAYVKPEAADKYVGMDATDGKKFMVDAVTISGKDGKQEVVKLQGKPKGAVESPTETPDGKAIPAGAQMMNPKKIEADPRRFQFRTEMSESGLGDVDTYNPDLGGVISVWKDPADGKTYVVNGHHRLDLAKRAGADNVLVRYLDVATAKEARAIGALQNIAEDKASAIDAAKFLRDSGKTPEDLKAMGFPLTGKAAKDGLALSRLSDPIFERVTMGEIPTGRAAVIGEELPDYADQSAILQMIDLQGKKGVRLTDAEIREMARDAKADQKVSETTMDLFGESTIEKSSSVEKAKLSVWLQKQLSRDKKLFGYVAKTERARELAKAGNIIDVDQSKKVAEESKITAEVYQRLVRAKGPIADALRQGAARWAKGEDERLVKADTYKLVQAAVEKELAGTANLPEPEVKPFHVWTVEHKLDPEDMTLGERDKAFTEWRRETNPLTESRLREVLGSHPNIAESADDLVDVAKVIAQNAVGMDLDEFLQKHVESVKFDGDPGDSALRQDVDEPLRAWVRKAGQSIDVEPYGEQLSMFGDPEKAYMLRNKKGQEALVLQSQLDKLAAEFPHLAGKLGEGGELLQAKLFGPDTEVIHGGPGEEEPAPKEDQQLLFQEGRKGATKFLGDSRAVMYLFKNADASTFLHEFIHTMEPYLKPEDRAVIDKWLDSEGIDKPVARKEALARAFEEFHMNGEAPTEAVKPIFQRIQEVMRKIYEAIKDSPLIKPSKEVENLFNRWYGGDPEKLTPEGEIEQLLGKPLTPVDISPTSLFFGEEGVKPKLEIDDKSEAAKEMTAPPEPHGFEPPPGMEVPGPGAKNVNTVRETPADILQLRDSLAAVTSPHQGLFERLGNGDKIASAMSRGANNLTEAWNKMKATSATMWNAYRNRLPWTDFKDMLGKWQYADQKSENDAYQFAREITRKVPDKVRREAIVNYIESNGDPDTLLGQYIRSTNLKYKEGYKVATELTESEQILAQNIKNYFESRLQAAIDADLLESGVENYVNRIVKFPEKSDAVKKLMGEIAVGKLQTNPRFAMKRIFETSFAVEQAGFEHVNKDIGFLVTAYDLSFNRALSARAFVKSLLGGHASDGRPLTAVSGSGKTIPTEEVGEQAYVIRPTSKPEETYGYKRVDHPALRKWKWIAKDQEDNPMYLQGDLLVHPEAYTHLKNVLSKSVFRQHPIPRTILKGFTDLKGTMLSLSPFHQVQVGTHGVAHWVNPTFVPEIDWEEPKTRNLISHGLQVVNHHALEEFSDGVGGSGYIKYIPGIGKLSQDYQAYLFGDYIPRLKTKMALEALGRNKERYGAKMSNDQIYELTANQANAAFGELNYRMLGRNPSFQDAMRLILLAPDFLEARSRFVGQALKPGGREQAIALIRIGGIIYGGARVMNMMFNNNDPKWDKPFSVVIGGHEYAIRSVPGDLYHLATDWRGFFLWRVNPFTVRPAVNLLYGKDNFGHKQSAPDAGIDYLKQVMPLPLEGLTRPEVDIWKSMMESLGIRESVYRTPAADLAHKMQLDSLPANLTKEQLLHSVKIKDLQKQYNAGTLPPWELAKKVDSGELTEADEKKIEGKEGKYDELQRNLTHRSAKEAMQIWALTTPQEKAELRDQMLLKVKRSQTITAKEREQYTQELMKDAFVTPQPEGFHWPLSQ